MEKVHALFMGQQPNQMLMEIMGLHLPGAAFIHPHSDLRNAYNVAATQQAI